MKKWLIFIFVFVLVVVVIIATPHFIRKKLFFEENINSQQQPSINKKVEPGIIPKTTLISYNGSLYKETEKLWNTQTFRRVSSEYDTLRTFVIDKPDHLVEVTVETKPSDAFTYFCETRHDIIYEKSLVHRGFFSVISAKKEGYNEATKAFKASSDTTITISLEKIQPGGFITFICKTGFKEITANNKQTNAHKTRYLSGKYTFKATSLGMNKWEKTITVMDGDDLTIPVDFEMTSTLGILDLEMIGYGIAKVIDTDGNAIKLKSSKREKLHIGKYILEFWVPNERECVSKEIDIKKDEITTVRHSFIDEPINSSNKFSQYQQYGELLLSVYPPTANVQLIYEDGTIIEQNKWKQLHNLPIGNYSLNLSAFGYRSQQSSFAITPFHREKIRMVLAKSSVLYSVPPVISTTEIGMKMVEIKGGSYIMGNDTDNETDNPEHEVTVKSFLMGQYEVTRNQWEKVMNLRVQYYRQESAIVNVRWEQAVEFCNRLSKKEGLEPCYYISSGKDPNYHTKTEDSFKVVIFDPDANGYRLPTEAEWEYAAKGGVYPNTGFTPYIDLTDREKFPKDIKPNTLGLYNITEDVTEWCNDWYDKDYYSKSPTSNPMGPKTGEYVVYRGFDSNNISRRYYFHRHKSESNHGFRVVRNLE